MMIRSMGYNDTEYAIDDTEYGIWDMMIRCMIRNMIRSMVYDDTEYEIW